MRQEFKAALATLKHELDETSMGLFSGLQKQVVSKRIPTMDDAKQYYHMIQQQALSIQQAVVIDMEHIFNDSLSDQQLRETLSEQYLQDIVVHKEISAPLNNMIMYFGNSMGMNAEKTKIPVAVEASLGTNEDKQEVLAMTLYGLTKSHANWMPLCPTTILIADNRDLRLYNTDESAFKIFYQDVDPVEAFEQYKQLSNRVMTYVTSALFLYKYNRMNSKEVSVPTSRNTKRIKRDKAPYTTYKTATLGNYSRTLSSHTGPSEGDFNHKALHIRLGHWRRPIGYRDMPKDQVEKGTKWMKPTLVGDPQYGIIIKDYKADLLLPKEHIINV